MIKKERFHYLLIKRNTFTGLKYLCRKITTSDEKAIKYLGSGTRWRNDIEKYGKDKIEHGSILFKCEEYKLEEFKRISLKYSIDFDIVNSNEWANLIHETGDMFFTFGSMNMENQTKGKLWIYKNDKNKRILKEDLDKYKTEGWDLGLKDSTRKKVSDALKGRTANNKGIMMKKPEDYISRNSKRKYGIVKYNNDTEKRRKTSKECLNRPEVLAKFKAPRKSLVTARHMDGRIETHGRKEWKNLYNVNCWKMMVKDQFSKGWKVARGED